MKIKLTATATLVLGIGIIIFSLIHEADSSQKIKPDKSVRSPGGVETKFVFGLKPSLGDSEPYKSQSSLKTFRSKAIAFAAGANISEEIATKVTHNF